MDNQNHKGTLTEKEIKELDEWSWVPFNGWERLHYAKYASDILNYRPLFGKELNSTKILILIKLWETKTKQGVYHTEEVLGRAAGIDSTCVSRYLTEMCESKLKCEICGQVFGIMEKIGSHLYETGKEGNLYSLEKIENLLKHISKEHNQPNSNFYEYLKKAGKPIKTKSSIKQLKNLKNTKKCDF